MLTGVRSAAVLLLHLSLVAPAFGQGPDGLWSGAIAVMGTELKILVAFTGGADSTRAAIDIPQQLAFGLALKNIRWLPPAVHFELPAGPGLAVFDGRIQQDTIRGDFSQAGIKGTFVLGRSSLAVVPPAVVDRDSAVPYAQEEVIFSNGRVTLAGTLTIPSGGGPHPAVVMISGSGPQNRDEELFGFRPFRVIADHLTRNGIAVLRYDDRGVGGSSGNTAEATSEDFARDALAGLALLQKRTDVNPRQIGLCGHSEGGIVATMAASLSHNVAFIVLIAGTAVSGETIVLSQLESLARAGGATGEQIDGQLALQHDIFRAVKSDTGWAAIEEKLRYALAANLAAMPPDMRAGIDSATFIRERSQAQLAGVRTPWFRFFATYDPASALEEITCPVLALFGGRDVQVPASLNQRPMEQALRSGRNADWQVKVFPTANHLFQNAGTGTPHEYAALPKQFVEGFLETITGWIVARVTVCAK